MSGNQETQNLLKKNYFFSPSAPPIAYDDSEIQLLQPETAYVRIVEPLEIYVDGLDDTRKVQCAYPIPECHQEAAMISKSIRQELRSSQLDGERIVDMEYRGVKNSETSGSVLKYETDMKVLASNQEREFYNFEASTSRREFPMQPNKDHEAFGSLDANLHKEYKIPEYKSMYDENNSNSTGYEIKEYKSIYDTK